ncbi:MAG: BlaI/MecI/CopY family transcriptional regulator [Verrucomicrobia bacterium]|jgi:BlaI family transcriptional regulator, penicillinase repressor|nr:BlaI/MecI/CopY family transcriptional regulator [Verrucomicrobiota bacterium]
MARKKSSILTDAEHRIMEVLWDRGQSTVADVTEAISGQTGSAYNTVLTMMRILHEKKYLKCRKVGRAHVYAPNVNRQAAARSAVQQLLGKFFNDSPSQLVLSFLKDEDLSPDDLEALTQKIQDMPEEGDES